jgi:hypothetical protein
MAGLPDPYLDSFHVPSELARVCGEVIACIEKLPIPDVDRDFLLTLFGYYMDRFSELGRDTGR